MKNVKYIEPKGKLAFLTYISDRGGVGHIRTIFPSVSLGSWRYKKMTFEPVFLSTFIQDPTFYKIFAFVKWQRAAIKSHKDMIEYFKTSISKQTNIPVIYEIDDMLFDIPKWNFASKYYKDNEENIKKILSLCDGITVSTPYLKKVYNSYNSNISVVSNRLLKSLWGDIKQYTPKERKKPKILYPGSQNHFSVKNYTEGDGGDFGKTLIDYIQKTTDKYEWIFIGGIPEELKNNKDITYYDWLNILDYPNFIKSLDVDIGLAPLEINDFNRGKSELKALEYMVSGIPGIFTEIDPYKECSLTCKTEEDIIENIERLAFNPERKKQLWKNEYNRLKHKAFFEDNRLKWVNEHLKLFNKKIK